jgi:hypothetical protein
MIRGHILGIVSVTPWEDSEVDVLRELALDLVANDKEGDGDDSGGSSYEPEPS